MLNHVGLHRWSFPAASCSSRYEAMRWVLQGPTDLLLAHGATGHTRRGHSECFESVKDANEGVHWLIATPLSTKAQYIKKQRFVLDRRSAGQTHEGAKIVTRAYAVPRRKLRKCPSIRPRARFATGTWSRTEALQIQEGCQRLLTALELNAIWKNSFHVYYRLSRQQHRCVP